MNLEHFNPANWAGSQHQCSVYSATCTCVICWRPIGGIIYYKEESKWIGMGKVCISYYYAHLKCFRECVKAVTQPVPCVTKKGKLKTVPAFQFKLVLLHALAGGGWEIIGIGHDGRQEVIATLTQVTGHPQARRLADQLAKNLAGKPFAEED